LLVREVGRVIAELKRSGLSILLVEQNLGLALSVADRVHVLSRGQIVHTGTPAELMRNEEVKARYLGVA
jgi:branched-chain amino acid transport system ATP-binding protein